MAGAAFGSAVNGLRPVVEIMFGDFLTLAMDTLVNQATKYWFLTGEQVSVPLVFRSVVGAGGRFGAIHSQMPASWFMGIPGLKIVAPSTPADAKGAPQGRRSATTTRCSSSSTSASTRSRARRTARSAASARRRWCARARDVTLVTRDEERPRRPRRGRAARGGRRLGRGHRPAHAAPARRRHDPRARSRRRTASSSSRRAR